MQANTTNTPLAGLRLMIVDDDVQTRTMMDELLQSYGAETLWASNAREATRLLSEEAVHVILSDIGLPDLDGYELMRRLRQPGTLASETPAIALTGFAQANDEHMAREAGYQGFATKPIDVAALVALIQRLADRSG
jgi:CheY-like chemotaxis protein